MKEAKETLTPLNYLKVEIPHSSQSNGLVV